VVQRWSQLPLDQALRCAGRVRAFVQSLADEVAQATGTRRCGVPDCGPAALMDQLTVMVYDASAAEVTATRPSTLVQDLVTVRHELR